MTWTVPIGINDKLYNHIVDDVLYKWVKWSGNNGFTFKFSPHPNHKQCVKDFIVAILYNTTDKQYYVRLFVMDYNYDNYDNEKAVSLKAFQTNGISNNDWFIVANEIKEYINQMYHNSDNTEKRLLQQECSID